MWQLRKTTWSPKTFQIFSDYIICLGYFVLSLHLTQKKPVESGIGSMISPFFSTGLIAGGALLGKEVGGATTGVST